MGSRQFCFCCLEFSLVQTTTEKFVGSWVQSKVEEKPLHLKALPV